MNQMANILDINLDEASKPEVLPGDKAYQVKISKAMLKTNEQGDPVGITVILEAISHPNAEEIIEFLFLPRSEDTESRRRKRLWVIREFVEAFKIPNYKDLNTWTGRVGTVVLKEEHNDRFGHCNKIASVVAPTTGQAPSAPPEKVAP